MIERVIVVRLEGGLGNQLFQYWHGRALQSRYGGRLVLDDRILLKSAVKYASLRQLGCRESFSSDHQATIVLSLIARMWSACIRSVLKILISQMTRRTEIQEWLGIFSQVGTTHYEHRVDVLSPVIYVSGNWLSEKFFGGLVPRLDVDNFAPPNTDSRQVALIGALIDGSNSVAVHVRLGDYTNPEWRDVLLVCGSDYYSAACHMAAERIDSPKFFVFSTSSSDLRWIQENLAMPIGTVFVENTGSDVNDFLLMKRCKAFVISNSTFSWWASYLGESADKLVIAPRRWNNGKWDVADLLSDKWELIDN